MNHKKKLNYRAYRFVWIYFRKISIYAGRKMIEIAKESDK